MSILKLKGSSSGYVELTAPATAGNNQITLPTTAGTVAVVDGSGRLGINTTSPGSALQVNGSGGIRVNEDGAGTYQIQLRSDWASQGPAINVQSNHSLIFATNGTERARLDTSGRFGVGTAPSNALHVYSTAAADAAYIQSNQTYSTLKFVSSTNTNSATFGIDGQGNAAIENKDTGKHITFVSGGAETARFDSSKRMLIGATSTSTTANTKLVIQQNNAPKSTGGPEAALFLTTGDIGGYALQMGAYNSGSLSSSYTWISSVRSNDAFDDGSLLPPLTFLIAHSECMRINGQKELLIGYTSDNGSYKLQVNSQIFATSSTIATSDAKYKENVSTLDGCFDLVKSLRPVSFTWKPQQDITRVDEEGNEVLVREGHNFPDGTQVGFIAQEVQEVLVDKPWLGSVIKQNVRPAINDDDGNELAPEEEFLGIAEGNLIAVLTSALQEAVAKIETLEAQNADFSARLAALESA